MRYWLPCAAALSVAALAASAWARWDAAPPGQPNRSVQAFRTIRPAPPGGQDAVAQASLGEALFADKRLSGGGRRACSSCHDLDTNGASGQSRDVAPDGRALAFNTPTVFNAAASFRLNWEGGVRDLETQARRSIENPTIMGGDVRQAAARLRRDPAMVRRFRIAFGRDPNAVDLVRALARYEATLVTPDARFDRYLRGELGALSAQEQRGYRLFQSVGCSSCHQGVNIGGNLYQPSGVFHTLVDPTAPTMRVPSLRNVAATAPYFHDGSAETLRDAIAAMGRAQLNRVLTAQQIDDIAAFLRTLTGRHRGKAVTAAR